MNASASGELRVEARPSQFKKKRAAIVESDTGSGANVTFSWDKNVYGEVLPEPRDAVCGATAFFRDGLGVDQPLAVAGAPGCFRSQPLGPFLKKVPSAPMAPVVCNGSDCFWQNSITPGEEQQGDRSTRTGASFAGDPYFLKRSSKACRASLWRGGAAGAVCVFCA